MSVSKEQYLAGSYARLSQDDGDKTESDSIRNQKELIKTYLKKHPEIKLVKEYSDDGYSGSSFDRPGFQRMLEAAKEGLINCIIVKDLSRFGRSYIEMGQYMEQILPGLGVRFIAVNDQYDSIEKRTSSDQIIVPFKNLINDSYCRDISIKTRSNLETKRRRGDFVGPFCPYGYRKSVRNRNRLEVDPEAAQIVRRIFQMKIEGKSNGGIASRLNEEGVQAPAEYKRHTEQGKNYVQGFLSNGQSKWAVQSVLRILQNEIYVGTTVQGKTRKVNYKTRKQVAVSSDEWVRVEHTHEPIVSQNEFEIVQRLLMTDTRVSPGKDQIYIFSGLLYCGVCGRMLIRRTVSSGGKKYIYYGCYDEKKKLRCPGVVIREADLMPAVLETLKCHIQLFLDMESLLEHVDQIPLKRTELMQIDAKIQEGKLRKNKLEQLKKTLYEDYRENLLEKEEYLDLKKNYTNELKRLKLVEMNLLQKKKDVSQGKSQREQYLELYRKYQNVQELDRRAMVTLIEKIIVQSGKKIEIVFAYQDEFNWMQELVRRIAEE